MIIIFWVTANEGALILKQGMVRGFIQYIKFGTIGLTSGALDIGSLNFMLFLWPAASPFVLVLFNTLAYSLAVLNSYIWNSRFTFREGLKRSKGQKLAFIVQAAISLLISDGILYAATILLSWLPFLPKLMDYNIAKLLSMFLSSLASFFFMKYFVFSPIKETHLEKRQVVSTQ